MGGGQRWLLEEGEGGRENEHEPEGEKKYLLFGREDSLQINGEGKVFQEIGSQKYQSLGLPW